MKIADLPEFKTKPRPLTCTPGTNLRDVAKMMAQSNYGSMVVAGPDEKVLGLITERDFLNRVVAADVDPDSTTVGDIMTDNVRVAHADDDLLEWMRVMSNERFRRLPVVDDNGTLVNVVTQGDFVSYTWPDLISKAKTFVQSTASNNRQVLIVIASVLVYTVALIWALRFM